MMISTNAPGWEKAKRVARSMGPTAGTVPPHETGPASSTFPAPITVVEVKTFSSEAGTFTVVVPLAMYGPSLFYLGLIVTLTTHNVDTGMISAHGVTTVTLMVTAVGLSHRMSMWDTNLETFKGTHNLKTPKDDETFGPGTLAPMVSALATSTVVLVTVKPITGVDALVCYTSIPPG